MKFPNILERFKRGGEQPTDRPGIKSEKAAAPRDSSSPPPPSEDEPGRRFPVRKIVAVIIGVVGIGGFAYFFAGDDILPAVRTIFQIVIPAEEGDIVSQEPAQYEEEEAEQPELPVVEPPPVEAPPVEAPPVEAPPVEAPPVEAPPVEEQPEPQVSPPEPTLKHITSTITIIDSNTNEPLRHAWIYKDSDDTECITGIEGTFCVTTEPDCVTDERGICFMEMELGEHSLLIKTLKDGATTFSQKETVSISPEYYQVTIHVSRSFPAVFEIKTEDLGTFVDGAKIYVDGKLLGIADNGKLSERIDMGPHNVLVKYKNQFGREVVKRIKVNVEEQLENKFAIQIPVLTYEEIRDHALSLINADREKVGLEPLVLIENGTAQNHAEEMVREGYLSNLNIEGLKPYMRYTLSGGIHALSENAALAHCGIVTGDNQGRNCISDPVETIGKLHNDVMLKNTENNRNRDNILNRWHNGVSIGIAYSSDFVALVQDFEGEHISWDKPITVTSDGVLEMSGRVNLRDFKLTAVAIYRDELPWKHTPDMLSEGLYSSGYDRGELVTTIDSQSLSRHVYRHTADSDFPNKWIADEVGRSKKFEISFPLIDILLSSLIYSNDGIYTIYLLAENTSGEQIPLTNYSLEYKDRVLTLLDGSELWRCNLIPSHRC